MDHQKMEFVKTTSTDGKPLYEFNIPNLMGYYTSVIYDGNSTSDNLRDVINGVKGSHYDSQNSFLVCNNEDNNGRFEFVIMYPPNADELTLYLNREKCINALECLFLEVRKQEDSEFRDNCAY